MSNKKTKKNLIKKEDETKKQTNKDSSKNVSKKLKLVIATDNYLPRWDGISRFLSEIVPLISKDFELTVIIPNFGKIPKSASKNITIEKIPLSRFHAGDFQLAKFSYFRIKSIIKKSDMVFSQTIGPIGACAILSAKTSFKPLITFTHNIEWELFPKIVSSPFLKKFLYPVTKKFVKFLYNKSNLIIVPSSSIADMLSWQNIISKKEVVHLGVNTSKFVKGNKQDAKKEIGFKPRDFVVGYHGRLGREKDLKTLMRAFVRVRAQNPATKLLIVGSGSQDIENVFKNQEGVYFVGQKDDVIPYIQAMDVYVIPSLTETTSLSTLEAMSCEVAVIATRVGYIKDYIIDGKNGFFFEKQNTFDLFKKICMLMDNSSLRAKIGSEARKTVEAGFRWEETANRIRDALHELAKK